MAGESLSRAGKCLVDRVLLMEWSSFAGNLKTMITGRNWAIEDGVIPMYFQSLKRWSHTMAVQMKPGDVMEFCE